MVVHCINTQIMFISVLLCCGAHSPIVLHSSTNIYNEIKFVRKYGDVDDTYVTKNVLNALNNYESLKINCTTHIGDCSFGYNICVFKINKFSDIKHKLKSHGYNSKIIYRFNVKIRKLFS
jgi:hypothetical protein